MKGDIPINIIPNIFDNQKDILFEQNRNINKNGGNLLSIYIHYPFCRQKCGFCQIETTKYDSATTSAYVSSLIHEITLYGEMLREYRVDCVHFGGGTPSLMSVNDIENILNVINKYTDINEAELLFEIHPAFVSEDFKAFVSNINNCTVNFGVQSFDNTLLSSMHRGCTGEDVVKKIEQIHMLKTVGIDIICDLPNSNQKTLNKDIRNIKELDIEHISLYPFDIRNTPLSKKVRYLNNSHTGLLNIDEKISRNEIFSCMLMDLGYEMYSIFHYSKKNVYTHRYGRNQMNGGNWIGFGANAYTYLNDTVYINSEVDEYINRNYIYKKKKMNYTECVIWDLAYAFRKVPISKDEIYKKHGLTIAPYIDRIVYDLEKKGLIDSLDNLQLNWAGIIDIKNVERVINDSFAKGNITPNGGDTKCTSCQIII